MQESRHATLQKKVCHLHKTNEGPGMPKSSQHKAAISAALKAKWSDPSYVASQKRATRVRTSNRAARCSIETTADNDVKMRSKTSCACSGIAGDIYQSSWQ